MGPTNAISIELLEECLRNTAKYAGRLHSEIHAEAERILRQIELGLPIETEFSGSAAEWLARKPDVAVAMQLEKAVRASGVLDKGRLDLVRSRERLTFSPATALEPIVGGNRQQRRAEKARKRRLR